MIRRAILGSETACFICAGTAGHAVSGGLNYSYKRRDTAATCVHEGALDSTA